MNDSSMDMTAVCSTIDATKRELLAMKEKNEAIFQENHHLKKRIEILERTNCDLESELTFAHSSYIQEKSKLTNLQNDLDYANSKIKTLESLLEDERIHVQNYIKETNEEKDKQLETRPLVVPDQEQLNILTGQIQKLEEQLENEHQNKQQFLNEKALLDSKVHQFKCENQVLKDELSEIKEHLQQKIEDFRNVNETLETTREEKLLLSIELQMLKTSEKNAPRGNSLFAEVEENRQKVAAQREALKLKYINLKKVLNQKQVENNKLKLEIVKIRRAEKDDEKNVHADYSLLIQTYKDRVSDLEEQLKILQQHAERPPVIASDCNSASLNWVNTVVESARKETRNLQVELERRSSNYVIQGHQLFDTQKENRKIKATNSKLQSEIEELRLKLDLIIKENEDDVTSPPQPVSEVAVMGQKGKTVRFQEVLHDNSNVTLSSQDKDSDKEN